MGAIEVEALDVGEYDPITNRVRVPKRRPEEKMLEYMFRAQASHGWREAQLWQRYPSARAVLRELELESRQ